MASVLSHPAIPLALAVALGPDRVSPALAAVGCAASVLPDVDALGYAAGIPYGSLLGHRGLTHSLAFALLAAGVCALFSRQLGAAPLLVFFFVLVSAASHGLLDSLTTGGMGVAFFSPFSNARYFLPWRVIRVSPIGVTAFLSRRGLRVLQSEVVWIWLPAAFVAGSGAALRRLGRA